MSFLDTLSRPAQQPVMGVIAGEAGTGKTTLGAMQPKPILIRIEDGSAALDAEQLKNTALFPPSKTQQQVLDCIIQLATEEHTFKTVLVDSITAFDKMVIKEVQKRNNTTNLAACDGGFGGGYNAVEAAHQQLFDWCERLKNEKGMHVFFIGHTDTETVCPPDSEDYTRYTIQCTKTKSVDCAKVYTNNCDLVAFVKLKTFTLEKKARSTGERIITTYPTASHVSKNRFGITADLNFDFDKEVTTNVNPFSGVIKQLTESK